MPIKDFKQYEQNYLEKGFVIENITTINGRRYLILESIYKGVEIKRIK